MRTDPSPIVRGSKQNTAGIDEVCGQGRNPSELTSGFFMLCDAGGVAATEKRKWGGGVNKQCVQELLGDETGLGWQEDKLLSGMCFSHMSTQEGLRPELCTCGIYPTIRRT